MTTTNPTLPESVRRWALDHVIDRRLPDPPQPTTDEVIRGLRDSIDRQALIGLGLGHLVNPPEEPQTEIPESEVVWHYAGRIPNRFPLDVVIPCIYHPMPIAHIDDPIVPKIDRRFVTLKRHLFHFKDCRRAAYHIGQCPECRAVHWGDEQL